MLYHKIQSLYLRDPATKHRTFLHGQWSVPEFGFLANAQWEWTEKVDGTNVRILWDGERVEYGGRTDNAQMHAGLVSHLREHFTAQRLAAVFDGPAILFGEGYGAKIQKAGGFYRQDQGFVLFDVWCSVWLERPNVESVAVKLATEVVPIVGAGTLPEAEAYVRGKPSSVWGDFTAEGIVMRPRVELLTRRGNRIITKLKVKDFQP